VTGEFSSSLVDLSFLYRGRGYQAGFPRRHRP